MAPRCGGARRGPRGLTLLEVLLTVVVIGLLIGLLVPAIREVRRASQDTVSLSNLGQHTMVFHMYAEAWDGYWPAFYEPSAALEDDDFVYFAPTSSWPFFLGTEYYNANPPSSEVFVHPGRHNQDMATSYFYAPTHFTSPAFWTGKTRSWPDQWRAVGVGEVTFPSDNALHVEWHTDAGLPIYINLDGIHRDTRFGFSFSDGSARRERGEDLAAPIESGDGVGHGEGLIFVGVAGLHTNHGVQGRDID